MDVFPGWSMAELAYLGQREERCQITTGKKTQLITQCLHTVCAILNMSPASCSTKFYNILLQDAADTKSWHFKMQKYCLW